MKGAPPVTGRELDWFGVFEARFGAIRRNGNFMNAYYFKAFMLDEWEVRLCGIPLSPSRVNFFVG